MSVSRNPSAFQIRQALVSDIPALRALIELSVTRLHAADYSAAQIAGSLGTIFGVDTRLIADGTYYVVETAAAEIVGCGGWSRRKTLFGSDQAPAREDDLLDPLVDSARIRAFFVHPDWARQGIGTQLLEASESAARAAGFRSFELGATLTGERLYRARGYTPFEQIEVPLSNGASQPVIRMWKKAGL
ncbi:MAG: GNAT family N-acetyltransferase [Bryobacteraceae bacterium]|jgi:N-acetylglutamate synthase-like GNAT family acetyltransferase